MGQNHHQTRIGEGIEGNGIGIVWLCVPVVWGGLIRSGEGRQGQEGLAQRDYHS